MDKSKKKANKISKQHNERKEKQNITIIIAWQHKIMQKVENKSRKGFFVIIIIIIFKQGQWWTIK